MDALGERLVRRIVACGVETIHLVLDDTLATKQGPTISLDLIVQWSEGHRVEVAADAA